MNTPAHVLLGTTLFGRAGVPGTARAAIAGSLLPDLSLFLMVGVSIHVLGIPPRQVFDELYYSPAWQAVFAIDNSLVLWGAFLAWALWRQRPVATAFAAAGCLHLVCDFLLHHDDARRHFWPLSDWVFRSPVSYWDDRHYGRITEPLENLMCLVCAAVLWRRFPRAGARVLTLIALAAEFAPRLIFRMML